MGTRPASRTAVLVCQGRAVAHGRSGVGRFDHPTALALLRDGDTATAIFSNGLVHRDVRAEVMVGAPLRAALDS